MGAMFHKSSIARRALRSRSLPVVLSFLLCFANVAVSADSPPRFERTYTPRGAAHLTISNINGTVHIVGWDKRTIVARANAGPSVLIEDQVGGDDITISTRRNLRLGRADFEVSAPPETSLTVKNYVGDIEVSGINGHVTVNSIDSNVRLVNMTSPSIDVRVTSGDIFFDGHLQDGGSYSLQSMKGDLDVTVPAATPFNLNARALSENINLGAFVNSLTGSSRGPKGVSGAYLKGGPRLSLTSYAGRILLHKK